MTITRAQLERVARDDIAALRSPEGWLQAGLPRFARLFGRDSCISALQLLDDDPTIAAATIRALARVQGRVYERRREEEPGKIPHEIPVRFDDWVHLQIRKHGRWGFPYFGGIDQTSWWIRVVDAYVTHTGDRAIVDEVHDNLVRAASWMAGPARIGFADLVAYERRNPAALKHQGWRDSGLKELDIPAPVAVVEAQGYHAAAFEALGRLGIDPPAAARIDPAVVDHELWMDEEGIHGLAVGGDGRLVRMVTSNPGHLLGTPVLSDERAQRLASRLFADDLMSVGGIRTQSTADPHFDPDSYHLGSIWPHDNWVIHEGLRAIGRHDDAARLREAVLDALCRLEHIPELYAVHGTEVVPLAIAQRQQAWSSGAVVSFLAADR
jgi:glycogen debranching enzyme